MNMRNLPFSPVRRILTVVILGLLLLVTEPTEASQGTLTFQATVSGKGHDAGGFSHAIASHGPSGPDWLTFTGCAIIKQNPRSALGRYTFEVRTTGTQFAGIKPAEPGVNLQVDHFRSTASASSYSGLNVTGTFAINGHAYGDGAALARGTVQIRNGGLRGTWTDPTAQRNYPAKSSARSPVTPSAPSGTAQPFFT